MSLRKLKHPQYLFSELPFHLDLCYAGRRNFKISPKFLPIFKCIHMRPFYLLNDDFQRFLDLRNWDMTHLQITKMPFHRKSEYFWSLHTTQYYEKSCKMYFGEKMAASRFRFVDSFYPCFCYKWKVGKLSNHVKNEHQRKLEKG